MASPATTPASAPSSTSALRLKGAAHFVASDGAGKSQRDGAAGLYLHAERYIVSRNTSRQRRGGTSGVLKCAAQLRTILLDLNCSLLGPPPALPRKLPGPNDVGGLRVIR